jgi:hypothetical protein
MGAVCEEILVMCRFNLLLTRIELKNVSGQIVAKNVMMDFLSIS